MSPKWRIRRNIEMRIHPHTARFQLIRQPGGTGHILGPDRRAQRRVRGVRARNHVVFIAPFQHGQDGSEGFFLDDAGGLGRVIDDGRGDEEARSRGIRHGTAEGSLVSRAGSLRDKILDFLELHGVLDGSEKCVWLRAIADGEGFDKVDQFGAELIVDVLVHVQPLDHHADLAGAEERENADLGHDSVDIDVVADDAGIVTAQLQRHALEGLCAAGHDALPGQRRPGEADFADARVFGDHGPQGVIAAQGLDDTGREALGGQFGQLQSTVRGERRGFDDDGVTGVHSGHDLTHGQQHGEVPRHDGRGHADRSVPLHDAPLLRLLDDILGDFNVRHLPCPGGSQPDLHVRLGERLALLHGHKTGQGILVSLDGIPESFQGGATLVIAGFGPFAEGLLGGIDGAVQVVGGCDGHGGIGLAGGWVDAGAGVGCGCQFVVDDIVKGLVS